MKDRPHATAMLMTPDLSPEDPSSNSDHERFLTVYILVKIKLCVYHNYNGVCMITQIIRIIV